MKSPRTPVRLNAPFPALAKGGWVGAVLGSELGSELGGAGVGHGDWIERLDGRLGLRSTGNDDGICGETPEGVPESVSLGE